MISTPQIHALFDPPTSTLTYVVFDLDGDAVVIDPVIDYDLATNRVSGFGLKRVLDFVSQKGLRVHWILETHAHADHLTAGRELKRRWSAAAWAMGEGMSSVFENFRRTFSWPHHVQLKGLGVGRFFRDGEEFTAGRLRILAISTPGHTPACLTYRIENNLFTGDALMMPDGGTGRCDFPGGSAAQLYDSVWRKLYSYPDDFRVWVGHDYQPGGRPLRYQSTIGEQRERNVHLRYSTSRADFIHFRETRDKTLSPPRLLVPSLDWNLGAHIQVEASGAI